MTLDFPKEIPRLPARRDEDGFLHVWCKYCRKEHHHGNDSETVAHKVAHCYVMSSPYRETGYILVVEEEK
jgi:hypothetical protein